MSSERTLGAVSRLAALAGDYPELSTGITSLIASLVCQSKAVKEPIVANHRSNGHTNGFHSLEGIADEIGNTSQADRRDWDGDGRRKNPTLANSKPFGHKEWYTVSDLASMFQRTKWTICTWCRSGKIRAERIQPTTKRGTQSSGPRSWKIHSSEVERLSIAGFREPCDCRNDSN